jgi:hypothetical protein
VQGRQSRKARSEVEAVVSSIAAHIDHNFSNGSNEGAVPLTLVALCDARSRVSGHVTLCFSRIAMRAGCRWYFDPSP